MPANAACRYALQSQRKTTFANHQILMFNQVPRARQTNATGRSSVLFLFQPVGAFQEKIYFTKFYCEV